MEKEFTPEDAAKVYKELKNAMPDLGPSKIVVNVHPILGDDQIIISMSQKNFEKYKDSFSSDKSAEVKPKPVYNLIWLQKIELFFLKPYWYLSVLDNKKTWHEVKKGMEKHEHKFTKVFSKQGYRFAQCEHEGCNLCECLD